MLLSTEIGGCLNCLHSPVQGDVNKSAIDASVVSSLIHNF